MILLFCTFARTVASR